MYKEKAKLFRHNSVLVPLGDDFKYKTPEVTRKMMTQYEMMFKYINSDKTLGVNVSSPPSTMPHLFDI
jgi:alpha-mannosidase II